MSIYHCPIHGTYGGDVFCPKCGTVGDYVTFDEDKEPPDHGRMGKAPDGCEG